MTHALEPVRLMRPRWRVVGGAGMKLIAWALAALARRDAELAAENARLRRETISMSEQVMAMRVNLRDAHNLLRRHNAQASECRHGRCGPGSPWHDTIHWFGRQ